MPVGVIVFVEHWIFPKIGLSRYWAARKKLILNWPAISSWFIAVAVALFLERTGRLHLFFLFIPTSILTAVLYTLFSAIAGAREQLPELAEQHIGSRIATGIPPIIRPVDIKTWVWGIIAAITLIICIILSIWVYLSPPDAYERNFVTFKSALMWPTILYFISATAWAIRHEK
jgi:NCS1 family nucleobase:cation symporter-1